ncbi:MAG: AI-2E family transporter [Polyangiaceae bacterium]|nr:AI-2E family transporter [Polyangiaceae bacterium]
MTEPRPTPSIPPPTASDNQALAPTWFFTLFIATMVGLGYTLKPFLADLVGAFTLVALFHGTYSRLARALGGRTWLASALTSSWIVLVVAIPVSVIGYSLAAEVLAAFDATKEIFTTPAGVTALLEKTRASLAAVGVQITDQHVSQLGGDVASAVRDLVLGQATLVLNSGVSIVVHFTIMIVLVLYLLVDGPRLKRFIFDLSPLPVEHEELLVQKFASVSRGIVLGNGVSCVLQGLFGGIALWIVGLPAPILWGAAMTLAALLPVVGTSLVVLPIALYLVMTGKVVAGVVFGSFGILQSLILDNMVKTRLIGSQARMHDLLVFLSILGGLGAFGPIGILYGPLLAVAFLTLADLYRRTYRHVAAERITRGSVTYE